MTIQRKSLDLVECLLQLSQNGHYEPVKTLFMWPMKHCPDLLMLSLLQVGLVSTHIRIQPQFGIVYFPWNLLRNDIIFLIDFSVKFSFSQTTTRINIEYVADVSEYSSKFSNYSSLCLAWTSELILSFSCLISLLHYKSVFFLPRDRALLLSN